MAEFGKISLARLHTCDYRLQDICKEAIKIIDFSVLEGHRPENRQNALFHENKTKVMWPDSKHNDFPSLAVDIAPYPIDWEDKERFYYLAGVMKGIALGKGISLRWGGDWDSDNDFSDQTFDDLVHFELVQ